MLTEPVDAALLDEAPRLRVVSNMAVGVDNIDLDACAARGIPVGHTPGVLTEATADLTWALLLSAARRLPEAATDAREGRWTTWSPTRWLGVDLHGATMGIVGLGAIGKAVARRALGFGMRVLYTKRHPGRYDGAKRVELPELLSRSDFVSVHVPLSDETRYLIDGQALGRMKSTAILINTARGPIVDPAALAHALRTGRIRAAALDVTQPEPLPAGHELYGLRNCIVMPHIGSATEGTRRAMARLAVDNLLCGLRGEPLRHRAG
jgi:lactate dehydrogenase-like 2-hydroxyacid dehydrogenase